MGRREAAQWFYWAAGFAGFALAFLLAAEKFSPEWWPVLVSIAALLAVLACVCACYGVAELPVVEGYLERRRLDEKRRRREESARRTAEAEPLRREQEERERVPIRAELRAWEAFQDAALPAYHYAAVAQLEPRRLALAWPEFVRLLPAARKAAEGLPDSHRSLALIHMDQVEQAVAEHGDKDWTAWPPSNPAVVAINGLCDWIGWQGPYFRPLYLKCGREPSDWRSRVKLLTDEELAARHRKPK